MLVLPAFALVMMLGVWTAVAAPLQATLEKDQVTVTVDGKLFTAYKFAGTQKYPYFWPVNGPVSGKSVTTETSEPYPHHHSLFFGCDRVNGGNFWQEANERGQIVSDGPKLVTASGETISFTDMCVWREPGKDPILRDERRIDIAAPNATTRLIDFTITLKPLVDIRIEKTNHSLFSARVVPELNVQSGGALVNAEGANAEKGTFAVASPWCDYAGPREAPPGSAGISAGNRLTEGVAILQHPTNPWYPCKWFTRDYGFFSPTPMYWPENGEFTALSKDKPVTMRFRVVVHAGDAQAAAIADRFKEFAEK
jgi:hypothetical protein